MPAPFSSLSLAVVGAPYPNKDGSDRAFEILLCKPGEPVSLRPEPKNKHDERAVAVFSVRGVQIGYLTAERCGLIGGIIRSDREYRVAFQDGDQTGAWIRIAFDGAEPVLPAASRRPQLASAGGGEAHDFYPDEIWPDD